MDRQEAEEGDIEDNGGECAALQANGPGGTCYYCTRDGHFLQNCLRKAARLPHSAPLAAERRGGNGERPTQPTARKGWGKGPTKGDNKLLQRGNQCEPWREGPGRGRAAQVLEEGVEEEEAPETNVWATQSQTKRMGFSGCGGCGVSELTKKDIC